MKNTDQIRQHLNRMLMPQCSASETLTLVKKALALLPCKTCGGERNIGGSGYEDEQGNYVETETVSCSDCQPTENPLDFQRIIDCWSVHPIDDKDCRSCPQMHECRDFRKESE